MRPTGSPAPSAHGWSFRAGRLFGIDLYLHTTFLIFLAWVAAGHLLAGHGVGAAVDGLVMILGVFAVVVAHELGHALVARRFGIRTRDILLLPIGGIASLERLPDKPGQELLVALAGPAVNFALAAALAVAVALTGQSFQGGDFHMTGGPVLTRLMWINLSLGVFNLVPAFPMDGGRVLRALLAFRLEPARATQVAAQVGRVFALALGALGLLINPMLILIAVFVWAGAGQEAALARMKAVLQGVPVKNAMVTQFHALGPDETVGAVARYASTELQRDFPVVEGGHLMGVLTRGDLLRGLSEAGPDEQIRNLMHTDFVTFRPTEPVDAVLDQLRDRNLPAMVLDHGRLVGTLSLEGVGAFIALEEAARLHRPGGA